MYCATCGRETANGGSFCQWCGTGLAVPPAHPLTRKDEGILKDEYAGIGRRFVAFIIDLLFILVLDLFITGLFGLSEGFRMLYQRLIYHMPMTDRSGQVVNALVPVPVILSIGILVILVPWLYNAILEASGNQASLGKIALRIAVTDTRGDRVSFARATLRHFSKILILLTFLVGFIIAAFTRQKQGIHDIIAGCLMYLQ
jgi:uncharacterized RDD family membrane protein YckC